MRTAPLLLVLLVGCPCAPGGPVRLEIGTGETEFVPLDVVDHIVELVHGPQGGYHVLVSLRATGLATDTFVGSHITGTIDGVVRGEVSPWLAFLCDDGGQTATGAFLIYDGEPEALHEQDSHIEVSVNDIDGRTAEASADVHIFDPALAGGE